MTLHPAEPSRFTHHLRSWRKRRRLTQMELAFRADVSPRHLGFVETGRATPSRALVLRLAEELDMPLRDRNSLLVASGFAPTFGERPLGDPSFDAVRSAIEWTLEGHKPFPAFAIDRHWNIVSSNAALPELYEGLDPALLRPPVNVLRLSLHPAGLAPRVANLDEWSGHLLGRLRREIELTADPAPAVATPLRIETGLGPLSFLSTVTIFGTPVDVTLSEIALELFYPADEATREAVAAQAGR